MATRPLNCLLGKHDLQLMYLANQTHPTTGKTRHIEMRLCNSCDKTKVNISTIKEKS